MTTSTTSVLNGAPVLLVLDITGHVVENLQDRSPNCYAEIAKRDGALYFGGTGDSIISKYPFK